MIDDAKKLALLLIGMSTAEGAAELGKIKRKNRTLWTLIRRQMAIIRGKVK